jgi:hypothetical protein
MGSKVAEQVSLMKTAWTVLPLHEQQTMLNQLMLWFKRADGSPSPIHPTSSTSAVDLHIPSSTRALGTTKFVQGGSQSNLHMSTKWAHMEMCM